MQPSMVSETQPHSIQDVPLGPGGIKVCINASIGLAYNGTYDELSLYIVLLTTFMMVQNPQY